MLHDPDILVQVGALYALGELGEESVIPAVEKAASGANPFVRTVAKQVLAVVRCRQQAGRRSQRLRSPSSETRGTANARS